MPPRLPAFLIATCVLVAGCSSAPRPAGTGTGHASAAPTPAASTTGATASPSSAPTASRPATAPPAIAAPSGAPIPATGEYLYDQQGSETFCSPAACSTPRPLPPAMNATIRYGGPAGNGAHAIDLDLHLAPGRTIRVTSAWSSASVVVSAIDATLTESGVSQSATMRPEPPITLLSFPLRTGPEREQRFADGDTDGRFTQRVAGKETINAAGRRTAAWRVESTLTLTGEAASTIELTIWFDEATRTFLRLAATIDATYQITRYKASFTDTLSRRPG